MAKRKTKADKLIDARINRAVSGFSMPMMNIPAISAALKAAIAEGKSDEELKVVMATLPGVEAM